METFTIFFMIVSIIYMIFIFLRLRDIDHNTTANTNLIRRDIVDHDSHINIAVSDCALQVSDMEKNLTTEIACLATKNNEDIKRMGGKFEEWDLIDLDENEVLIYSAKPNANGQMVFNCVDKAGKMYTFFGSDKLNDAKFLRHTSSPFGEREV